MIEPYFAVWMKTKKELEDRENLRERVRATWPVSNRLEKVSLVAFVLYSVAMLLLSVVAMFNTSLLLPTLGSFAVFLLLAAAMNRVIILRDRRIPEWRMKGQAEITRSLRIAFKGVGLSDPGQVRLVREEAIRIMDRKEHQRETIIHISIEVIVLAALVCVLNFVVTLLEYDFPLGSAGLLAAVAVAIAAFIVFAVRTVWNTIDRFGALPVSKLSVFVDDLSSLLVDEYASDRSPVRRRRPPRRSRT